MNKYSPINRILLAVLIGLFPSLSMAKTTVNIPIFTIESPLTDYLLNTVNLALDASEYKYGPVEVVFAQQGTEEERQLRNLIVGINDVAFGVCTTERVKKYREIPIPLIGGLLGYRVAVVSKGSNALAKTDTLTDIKQMVAAQFQSWVDYDILQHHGFKLLATDRSSGYRAVAANIADYYPRSALEVDSELALFGDIGEFEIDKRFAIHYPLYYVLYVNKSNDELANRLIDGLNVMVKTGEFTDILKQQAFYDMSEKYLVNKEIIELSNPTHTDSCQNIEVNYQSIIYQPH